MLTLEAETTAARSLARQGLRLLESLDNADENSGLVLACLSSAAEKLLKLTLGLDSLDSTGLWPNADQMKKFSHDVVALNEVARAACLGRITEAGAPPIPIRAAMNSEDMVWTNPMLEALSDYGKGGRFYNLDNLAGKAQPYPSPGDMWNAMEQSVLSDMPELVGLLAERLASNADRRLTLNFQLARAFNAWWTFYRTCWQHGVLGDQARALSWTLKLS